MTTPARTQADLAETLGLARGTVNKILNGHPGYAPDTVAEVLTAADRAARDLDTPQVTQLDIARALGLSHATVSKAIRGGTRGTIRVSPETRARVLAKAKELGYVAPPVSPRRARRWGW